MPPGQSNFADFCTACGQCTVEPVNHRGWLQPLLRVAPLRPALSLAVWGAMASETPPPSEATKEALFVSTLFLTSSPSNSGRNAVTRPDSGSSGRRRFCSSEAEMAAWQQWWPLNVRERSCVSDQIHAAPWHEQHNLKKAWAELWRRTRAK
jgi:hypothetical protein